MMYHRICTDCINNNKLIRFVHTHTHTFKAFKGARTYWFLFNQYTVKRLYKGKQRFKGGCILQRTALHYHLFDLHSILSIWSYGYKVSESLDFKFGSLSRGSNPKWKLITLCEIYYSLRLIWKGCDDEFLVIFVFHSKNTNQWYVLMVWNVL